MKRLFVFGCSYTSYSWPTWANMLEYEYDQVENWALSGIGNRAIAERVAECNAKHCFTKDDVIIVQWSSHLRNDWWHQESMSERTLGWKTYGSIFNYHNAKLYDEKWLNTFFYEPAYFMHTLNNISLVQGMLDSIGCTYYMTSIGDIRNLGGDMRVRALYGEQTELITKYTRKKGEYAGWSLIPDLQVYEKPIWMDHADKWLMPMELFCQTCPDLNYNFVDGVGEQFIDLHPSVEQHRLWLKQELKDKLNLSDQLFDDVKVLAESVEVVQKKFRSNKAAFEYALGRKSGWPKSADKISWPGRPKGF